MSAPATAALRPRLPGDTPGLVALFRASIMELGAEDYSEDQCEAWAAVADDATQFAATLETSLTLVATIGGRMAGFGCLAGPDTIAMLYVDPGHTRLGVATLLLDALSRLATARGAMVLKVEASDTARDFFMVRGFTPMVRNMVPVGGEWLGNTSMERRVVEPDPAAAGQP